MPSQSRFAIWGMTAALGLGLSTLVAAQGNWDQRNNRYTTLGRGMTINVRLNDPIAGNRADYRVYTGVVEQDVRGENGRMAIPRGSTAELIVRSQRDGDLIVDLESVTVNGQRYAVETAAREVDTNPGLIGSILGEVRGGEYRGRQVRIPRGTVMGFRLERELNMGVADRGVMRDGSHYHDWYGRGRQ
jgi:hypothetical protein